MDNKNYIQIQGWMINELNLKGNELLLYAIIYGFSQDGEGRFYGSLSYLEDLLRVSRKTAIASIKSLIKKRLIKRSSESHYYAVLPTSGETPPPLVEKLHYPSGETPPNTNNNTNNIDILSKDSISSKIPILIDLFKDVNPSYKKLFGNKTERKAITELVEQFGYEKIEATIKALPGVIAKPYAPKITTPYQLQRDLGKLIAFVNQERGRQSKKGKEIIMTFNNGS